MRFVIPSAVCCLLSVCSFASDLKIVTVTRSGPNAVTSKRTEYFHGARSRTEWRDLSEPASLPGEQPRFASGPRRAMIRQCDDNRIVDLNLDSREYIERNLDKQAKPKPAKIAAQETDRGSLAIFIDAVDTGERKQMLGRTARHFVTRERRVAGPGSCKQSSETETDGWYVDLDVPMHACAAPSRGNGVSFLTTASCPLGRLEVHRTGPSYLGYPLKRTITFRHVLPQADGSEKKFVTTTEIEVTELSELPLDAKLFDVPDGFKQVSDPNEHSLIPSFVAVRQWWGRLVDSVSSLFG